MRYVKTVFPEDFFLKLFNRNHELLSLNLKKNKRNGPTISSAILSTLLEIFEIDKIEQPIKTILDLGAGKYSREFTISKSNTLPIVLSKKYNSILFDRNQFSIDNMISECFEMGLSELCYIERGLVCWNDQRPKKIMGITKEGANLDDAIAFPVTLGCIDSFLENMPIDLNTIVCADLDIDGGEIYIWEQSQVLKTVRPEVVSIEISGWHDDVPMNLNGDIRSGKANFFASIYKAKSMGYTPVVAHCHDLFFISNSVLGNFLENNPIVAMELKDVTFLFDVDYWYRNHVNFEMGKDTESIISRNFNALFEALGS